MNMPQIGFGTFQLFPDQFTYSVANPNLSTFKFNNLAGEGIAWIDTQAVLAEV
jgi:mannan endo-1,4-beta-mannosidase